jgi:hypothetical protein
MIYNPKQPKIVRISKLRPDDTIIFETRNGLTSDGRAAIVIDVKGDAAKVRSAFGVVHFISDDEHIVRKQESE